MLVLTSGYEDVDERREQGAEIGNDVGAGMQPGIEGGLENVLVSCTTEVVGLLVWMHCRQFRISACVYQQPSTEVAKTPRIHVTIAFTHTGSAKSDKYPCSQTGAEREACRRVLARR